MSALRPIGARGAALTLSLALTASSAFAAPPAPSVGDVPQWAIDRARAEMLFEAHRGERPQDCGDRWDEAEIDDDLIHHGLGRNNPSNGDNDATHYARGNTLILHFFIDHNAGTWQESERQTAAGKAAVAKDHYRTIAPAGANIEFDNGSNNLYAYYITSINESIGESGLTWDMTEQACQNIGYTDDDGDGFFVDDVTYNLQDWAGGFDNVICCFQAADVEGRAFASFGVARTRQYIDDSANVWAHEWGHIFGSCDEYDEDNSGVCVTSCGDCQSVYLPNVVQNSNCTGCNQTESCIMDNNTFSNVCDFTLRHWAWVDLDNSGMLDLVFRRESGDNMVPIYEMPQAGNYLWNATANQGGFVYHQGHRAWAVTGLRSPAGADYDMWLYGDNNHEHYYTGSTYKTAKVDFVVGDYHHNNLGNEHVAVTRYSGDTSDYRIQYESGTGVIHPDGVARTFSMAGSDVVRVWDLPMFAGEQMVIVVNPINGANVDLGVALFKSNGDDYWAGRGSAQFVQDAGGNGNIELAVYDVPEDDVYGLVVFNNTFNSGDYTIQVGPAPVTLAEEVPFASSQETRLYNYDPIPSYWSFLGCRPDGDLTDLKLELFAESTYETELETNDYAAGAVDFIAVDYNHVSSAPDYVRVNREAGNDAYETEWEQSADVANGPMSTLSYAEDQVGKIWDTYLSAGIPYAARSYTLGFDDGLYLFDSSDQDYYQARSEFDWYRNATSSGGEFMKFTPSATDWHGLVQINYQPNQLGWTSTWVGREIMMADETAATYSDDVLWGETTTTATNWSIWAVRPTSGATGRISLYGDEACTITELRAADNVGSAGEIAYVVADYNHTPLETVYPRAWVGAGSGNLRVEFETQNESLFYSGGAAVAASFTWSQDDVGEIFDVYLRNGVPTRISVEPLNGSSADYSIALFQSAGATYYADPNDAILEADLYGPGEGEYLELTPNTSDYFGLVVLSADGQGGQYRITVGPQSAVSAGENGLITELAAAAFPNPSRETTQLQLALPRAQEVSVEVFDLAGRLVRQVADGPLAAGSHQLAWDGRDAAGRRAAAGVYFARIRTAEGDRTLKFTRIK